MHTVVCVTNDNLSCFVEVRNRSRWIIVDVIASKSDAIGLNCARCNNNRELTVCEIASPAANVPVTDLTVTVPVPEFHSVTVAVAPVPLVMDSPVWNVPLVPVITMVAVDLEDTSL